MAHKRKPITPVRRLKGQLEAVERALVDERGCGQVMRTLAAARGAMNALAAEVLCDHVDDHLGASRVRFAYRRAAAAELSQIIRQFVG